MMMSPESYVSKFDGLPLMDLAAERDRLFYDIEERRRELSCDPAGCQICMDPSPEVVLSVMEDYLLAMDKLIADKEIAEGCSVESLPFPDGFISACEKAYDLVGPIFMAEEMLGCWVFSTTRVLTISGPVGVVIATGELVHFHIPALMSSSGVSEKHGEQISKSVGYPRETILNELLDEEARRPVYRVPDRFRS